MFFIRSLNRENIVMVSSIQHIVFCNIKFYDDMVKKYGNFDIKSQDDFTLLCEIYIKKYISNSSDIICLYDNDMPTFNKYIISTKKSACIILIDLMKSYFDCLRIGLIQKNNNEEISVSKIKNINVSELVKINIFNTEFKI